MKKRYKNWILAVTYITAIAVTLLSPVLVVRRAEAVTQQPGLYNYSIKGEFIDGSRIKVDITGLYLTATNQIPVNIQREFTDDNPYDDELRFRDKGQQCGDTWILLSGRTTNTGSIKIQVPNTFDNNNCVTIRDGGLGIGLSSPENNQLYFNWEHKDSIASITQGFKLGRAGPDSKEFNGKTDKSLGNLKATGNCTIKLDITNPNNENGNLTINCNNDDKPRIYTNVRIGNAAAAAAAPGAGSGGVDATGDSRPSCETTSGNPLSWGLCPAINGAAAIADWVLEAWIVPFLENVPISTDRGGDSTGVFDAWSGFRILANIMLVGVLLFIVIAEAVGKE